MTQLFEINVNLSPNHKTESCWCFSQTGDHCSQVAKDSLSGNDILYVSSNIVKGLEKK